MLSFIRSLFFGTKGNALGEKRMSSTKKRTKSATPRLINSTPIRGGHASRERQGFFEPLCVIRGLRRVSASLQSRIEMPDFALDTFTHLVAGRKGLPPLRSQELRFAPIHFSDPLRNGQALDFFHPAYKKSNYRAFSESPSFHFLSYFRTRPKLRLVFDDCQQTSPNQSRLLYYSHTPGFVDRPRNFGQQFL
jgi:hypothetical protein